jgi:hypothetical protein
MSPGKQYHSSDYFVSANPVRMRHARRRTSEQATPTSLKEFFDRKGQTLRRTFRMALQPLQIRLNGILPESCTRESWRQNW